MDLSIVVVHPRGFPSLFTLQPPLMSFRTLSPLGNKKYNDYSELSPTSIGAMDTIAAESLLAPVMKSTIDHYEPTFENSLISPLSNGSFMYAAEMGHVNAPAYDMSTYDFTSVVEQPNWNLPGLEKFRNPVFDRVAAQGMKQAYSTDSFDTNSQYSYDRYDAQPGGFQCTVQGCEKVFDKLTNLKSHGKIHSVERQCVCDFCGASFRRSHDLKRHQRSIHTEVKSFQCIRCSKKFSRQVQKYDVGCVEEAQFTTRERLFLD